MSEMEDRVVSTLIAAGLVRRRRIWPAFLAAAAAAVVLAIGVWFFRPRHTLAPGNTYVLLLDVESYHFPPKDHSAERVAELVRWADSLHAVGKLERGGRLIGPGTLGGMFIIRAADDSDAARTAASCPFEKYGGHIRIERFKE